MSKIRCLVNIDFYLWLVNVRKRYFKISTKYQKLCFAKLYHKAPYILFELTVFFIGAMWREGGSSPPPKKNPLIFSILTFPDSLMLPWKDGRHFKIDRTRNFSSWGERMVGVGATVPKKISSHLLYLGFSTPWCYPEKMAGTSNLIRTCNFWRCWTTWHMCTHTATAEIVFE